MLTDKMMQEIFDLRDRGYSEKEVLEYYRTKAGKTPSKPTIRKYYRMDNQPGDLRAKLEKSKVFDIEPFRSAIIKIANQNPDVYISSMYDFLTEIFVETGIVEELPGTQQTLRNYVQHLQEKGLVTKGPVSKRVYDYVFDTPPGEQMQLDFGEFKVRKGLVIHFIAMVLRYSRMICVFAQDHRYNAEETCLAIYRAFAKLGGRPKILVIDQDTVMIYFEEYGEVIKTRLFEEFCTEQELKLFVCNKQDPQTKGCVENLVGFVKKNYFSARKADIKELYYVQQTLPDWVNRKNNRIHQQTYRVPIEVFEEVEREHLRPMLKSVYETAPSSYVYSVVGNPPYLQYNTSKYGVPTEYIDTTVHFKEVSGILYIYENAHSQLIAKHHVNPIKGSINRLDEPKNEMSESWNKVAERLRDRWNCQDFQHLINGFKKECMEGDSGERGLKKQLLAIESFLNKDNPERAMVAQVIKMCCDNFDYRFTRFKKTYEYVKSGQASSTIAAVPRVNNVDINIYCDAFEERCNV